MTQNFEQTSSYSHYLSSIEEVIEDARNGKMFILVDAEDRENEGDLVIPAQFATPDAINFMAKFGRGLICLPLTEARADELNLEYMARKNKARHGTGFTTSIEARDDISTGISAKDRALTISVAVDPSKSAADIVSPGHVFPLIAREGGVLVRTGHTEAAVDISRLAGLNPAGVICEIMNDDGTMARLPDLVKFAQFHNLKIATIEDLVKYRHQNDSLIERSVRTKITGFGGEFEAQIYVNTVEYAEHIALIKGDVSTDEPILVRMHAVNIVDDLLGTKLAAQALIQKSMEAIEKAGRGVIVLIRDTRPTVVSETILNKQQKLENSPPKQDNETTSAQRLMEYGVGAEILADLGVKNVILLSNSAKKSIVGLDAFGLTIVGQQTIG